MNIKGDFQICINVPLILTGNASLSYSMLQIREFQLVGQWAEGLKGILSPPGKLHISTSKKH